MTRQGRGDSGAAPTNRLASETSPYLLQHASNPVAWYPWGEEALRRARDQDKPIFLSIGYSTCHWCHVMAHESFEDAEVARLMNDTFVSIKVDREERPDLDHVYMAVCQMITGSAGWPLTIIMTPDGRPFFAATYIPRTNMLDRVGMIELVPQIKRLWATRRESVLAVADQVATGLRLNAEAASVGQPGDAGQVAVGGGAEVRTGCADLGSFRALLDRAYAELAETFDQEHGGFGSAPKFPMPHNLLLLLRYWKRTGRPESLAMVKRTLDAMRSGGIYDHLGFGFHRYSTDQRWLVPHFEKMLYDQALLAMAYAEAFQATGGAAFGSTTREILTYVLQELASPQGGFYAAEDADSEGEEGKFYLWTLDEIRAALGERDTRFAVRLFSLTEEGNASGGPGGLPRGANVLHTGRLLEVTGDELDVTAPPLAGRSEAVRQALLARRGERVRPGKDDKILADWNGLMIAALAKGSLALGAPGYAAAAGRAADFVLGRMRSSEGRLFHSWRDGKAGSNGNLDDYAFMVWGLVELYEATSHVSRLEEALALMRTANEHFWDGDGGGFYFTADDGEALLLRPKLVYDGALPSGNSVALLNLVRLARITGDADLAEIADRHARWMYGVVRQAPLHSTQALVGLDYCACDAPPGSQAAFA